MLCETVVIETKNGALTINKSDFDKKIHTLFGEPKQPKKQSQKKNSKDK